MNNSQLSAHKSDFSHGSHTATSQLASHNSPLNQLREKIRAVETENRRDDGIRIKHGCEAIDRLLPDGGYSRGTLIQWISVGGQGAEYLSLRVAQQACQSGGALVIADPCKQFFAPAAAAMGIDLSHLIVLQAANEKDLLWGIDQALRCPAVGAVWGWLNVIDQRQFRRFQLSAESSGAIGLFLQPYAAACKPSWAEVQWLVGLGASRSLSTLSQEAKQASSSSSQKSGLQSCQPVSDKPSGLQALQPVSEESTRLQSCQPVFEKSTRLRSISLQLTRCRGTHTGKSICITIDPVTGKIEPASRRIEATEVLRSTNSERSTRSARPTNSQPLTKPNYVVRGAS
jgi:protein ImuA